MRQSLSTRHRAWRWVAAAPLLGLGLVTASGALMGPAGAFNPQPDPPAFGLVAVMPGQTLRLNAVCSGHPVGEVQPGPCRAELMFHDIAGNTLKRTTVSLQPGQGVSFDLVDARTAADGVRSELQPCIIPDPTGGRLIPTAEVFDNLTGRTQVFVTPVAPRLSLIKG